jgi:hypothetical protein
MPKLLLCTLLIFSFLPSDITAQKAKVPAKTATAKKPSGTTKPAAAPAKQLSQSTSASTEVLAFISEADFYNFDKVIDISVLENLPAGTGVLYEYHGPQSIDCHKTLDKLAADMLLAERKKKNHLDYTLVVDWVNCKIISLEPYSTKPRNDKTHWTMYQISLGKNKINNGPTKSTIRETVSTTGKPLVQRQLILTTKDGHQWRLMTPDGGYYVSTISEETVLRDNFYEDAVYLCTRGIYKIYAVNTTDDGKTSRLNIREFLKSKGITDIPN